MLFTLIYISKKKIYVYFIMDQKAKRLLEKEKRLLAERGYVRGKDGKLKKKRLAVKKPTSSLTPTELARVEEILAEKEPRLLASTKRPPPPPPPQQKARFVGPRRKPPPPPPARPKARLLASTVRPPPPPPPVEKKKKEKQKRRPKRLVIVDKPKPPSVNSNSQIETLMEAIRKAKGSPSRKLNLLAKYNTIYNKQQPYLQPKRQDPTKAVGKAYDKALDNIVNLRLKSDKMRRAQPMIMKRQRIARTSGSYSRTWDYGKEYKTNDLLYPLNPEYMVESEKIEAKLAEATNLTRSMAYTLYFGKDKHVLPDAAVTLKFNKKTFDEIKKNINSSLFIDILKGVAKELGV